RRARPGALVDETIVETKDLRDWFRHEDVGVHGSPNATAAVERWTGSAVAPFRPGAYRRRSAATGQNATSPASLQRFQPARTSETWETVRDDRPRGTIVKVDVRLGSAIDRSFHIGERDIDDVGMARRHAEQGAAAAAAKRSAAVLGGLVA